METSTSDLPFHEWLRRRRRSLDLTVEVLADRAGCSPNTLRKLESGERRPSQQLAAILAEKLQIGPDQRDAFIRYARLGLTDVELPTGLPVVIPTAEAPPPPPSHLPAPPTRLIGREQLLAAAQTLLRHPQTRLLSLIGPAGVGKTRLAQELALQLHHAFSDGAAFVALADLHEPELLAATIARALQSVAGNIQSPSELYAALRNRHMLLVLDNLEHLPAAAELAALLEACPQLTLLITSRTALGLRNEQRIQVAPLDLPPAHAPPDTILSTAAVKLFVERVQALVPNFAPSDRNAPAIAAVCRRLDGLPLALELVAARARLLSPQAMLERIDAPGGPGVLGLLPQGGPDLPERHQSLRTAITWSERLLSPAARRLLARLSTLVGRWSLDTAEALGADDQAERGFVLDRLQELVESSLVLSEPDNNGEVLFSMLTAVREYAAERLTASGEQPAIQQRHAEYFCRLAEEAQDLVRGDQERLLALLDRNRDNLRLALRWALQQDDPTLAGRLGIPLWRYWWMSLSLAEGRNWLERILARPGLSEDARGRLLNGLSVILNTQGEHAAAIHTGEAALVIVRRTNNLRGISAVLTNLGNAYSDNGDFVTAERCYLEVKEMSEELEDPWSVATALNNLGNLARKRGEFDLARKRFQEAAARYERLNDEHGRALAIGNLGSTCISAGDYAAAQPYYAESLTIHATIGNRAGVANMLEPMARIAVELGLPDRAGRLIGAIDVLLEILRADQPAQLRAERRVTLDLIHQTLAPAEYAAAYAAGRALSFEETVAYAVEPFG